MPLKILIVDDSSSIRHLLRFFIEHTTYWLVCGEAENGQIAVEKVAQLKPHAVILDLSMPVMNGLDAAREITRVSSCSPCTSANSFAKTLKPQALKM
jgi:YesN/AraC family two-component response regulator